jgi:cholesterol transport system auxiliary component
VQLLDVAQNRIIATRDIAVTEPAPQNTPYGGVVAANRAAAKALSAIAQFCMRYL